MKLVKRQNDWFPSLWNDFFLDNRLDIPNYENFSIPAVNVIENLTTFVIELAAPGLKKEDFAIEIEENLLAISAEVTTEAETSNAENQEKFTRKEFSYTNFKRTFTLPKNVNKETINATYEDGVLRIALPKIEEKKLKKMVEIS